MKNIFIDEDDATLVKKSAPKKKNQTIAIDFDGVLADYSEGWQGKDVFGEMVPGADIATATLKKHGWKIIIFTTRENDEALKKWLKDNNIAYDYINENPDQPKDASKGKVIADIYLDDRGMRFDGNWQWAIQNIASFKPWTQNKKDEKKEMEQRYKEAEKWNCK